MKNLAKALAPAWVCLVAATGSTGGSSCFDRRFGPVVGTSAGTVGRVGGGDVLGGSGGGVVESGTADDAGVEGDAAGRGAGEGRLVSASVQPAAHPTLTSNAAIPHNRRMPGIIAVIVPG
jgi:hypothetical protein